jgi:hypothetical protein
MTSYFIGIDIRVGITSKKTDVKKKCVYFFLPSSRSLLKTVERLLKVAYKAGVILNIVGSCFLYIYSYKPPCKKEYLTSI